MMWVGTDYGLNRFDGQSFKWYAQPKYPLSSNQIIIIKEDQEGLLWLFSGLRRQQYDQIKTIDIFNPITEEVISFDQKFGKKSPFSIPDITSVTSLSDKSLIFFTKDKKHIRYQPSKGFIVHKLALKSSFRTFDDPRFQQTSWGITLQDSLNYFLSRSLVEIDENGKVLREFPVDHPKQLLLYGGMDEQGTIYYAAHNNNTAWFDDFYRVTQDKRTSLLHWFPKFLPEAYLQHPRTDWFDFKIHPSEKLLFSLIDKKLYAYNFEEDWVYDLTAQYPELYQAFFFHFDTQGRTWLGSPEGFYCLQFQKKKFNNILGEIGRAGEFSDVKSLFPGKDGKVYVAGGSAGFAVIDPRSKSADLQPIDTIFSHLTLSWSDQVQDPFNIVNSILLKRDLSLVLGMTKPIVAHKNGSWEQKKYAAAQWVGCDHLTYLFEDAAGQIWYSCNRNIGFINQDGFMEDFNASKSFEILEQAETYQFFTDSKGTVWLATNEGLFTLDTQKKLITKRFWKGGGKGSSLPATSINHIHEDKDGSFWLATNGEGLIRWNATTGAFQQFTRSDGLPSDILYAVYGDDNNQLWLSSPFGLARFDKEPHQVRVFLEKDGMADNVFNQQAHCQTADGTLFFGSKHGVTYFHPKDLVADTSLGHAQLVMTEFQVLEQEKNTLVDKTAELRQTKTIVLNPDDRFFRLKFALLTFEDVEQLLYAWKIDGLNLDWTYQKENIIQIGNLPYGHHTLRIKGQNSSGQWSPHELVLNIISRRPFYLQGWFLFTSLALLIMGVVLFFKMRTRQLVRQKVFLENEVAQRTETIQQQAEELKSLEKLKSRFFANVSHELRTPLTLILGPINTLLKHHEKNGDDLKLLQFAQRNAQQLQKLINEILDLSKLEDNKMEVVETPVHFFTYLNEQLAQFHSFASSDKLNFELKYQADQSLQILLDKSKFEKIIHNYLSNAMKFTPPGGIVTLAVEGLGDELQLSVADTGQGIHPGDLPHIFDRFYQSKQPDAKTEGGTGIGLSLVKELAELLGGKVWAESEIGKGSVFYFRFPKKTAEGFTIYDLRFTIEEPGITHGETHTAPIVNRKSSIVNTATVLIVEDNPDLREYLQFLLSDYQVFTAENGQQALDFMNSEAAQFIIHHSSFIIISDLMMPVMDGFQLLEKLKSDDRWRHLPVIMLTAKVNIRTKLEALRIGVDDYLTKPFQEEELKARIENLLHNYRERMAFHSQSKIETGEEAAAPNEPIIAAVDTTWLQEVEGIFTKHLNDDRLSVDFAAEKLNLSERQFSRRLQQLTGLTPNHYLQEMRLQRARDLLLGGSITAVKEAAFAVGFHDVRYFSSLFEKRFGSKPSSLRK